MKTSLTLRFMVVTKEHLDLGMSKLVLDAS